MVISTLEIPERMTAAHVPPRQPTLLERARRIGQEVARAHADDVDEKARFPHQSIEALKKERLMSAMIPRELGGGGADIVELQTICEALGEHCSSTAMIYAMHVIQVACIVRHHANSPFFTGFLREICERQLLLASVTSEVGVGGEMRTSKAGIVRDGARYTVEKDATTISYGAEADALLLTARASADAAPGDQALVLLCRGDYTLEKKSTWNTMGMRGTCSPSFQVRASGSVDHILPVPFATIASETMVPYSHILWSSCWLGIATSALSRARAFVRMQARSKPGFVPPGALRLAEASSQLQLMSTSVYDVGREWNRLVGTASGADESSIAFALKMNNLKVASSQLVVDIVQRALSICGINGYRNDSPFAVGRQLRDAYSAALMVANDRIYGNNASLLLVLKDD